MNHDMHEIWIIPIDELFESRVRNAIGAGFVLALVHCPVHAGLEESLGRLIRTNSNVFVQFIHIALQVSPNKSGIAFYYACTEFELFADEKNSFFVS